MKREREGRRWGGRERINLWTNPFVYKFKYNCVSSSIMLIGCEVYVYF